MRRIDASRLQTSSVPIVCSARTAPTSARSRPSGCRNVSDRIIRDAAIVKYPASVNRRRVVDLLVIVLIMGIPFAVAGGGIYYLAQQLTGTSGTATVDECHLTGTRATRGVVCTGNWVSDGGVVGTGTVNGAVSGDEGQRVDVTIRDGTAYTTSLATPVTLIALGGATAVLFGFLIWRGRRTKLQSAR